MTLSIVIPAKNEAQSLKTLLPSLRTRFPEAEIIIVDDGSTDETAALCEINGVHRLHHAYSRGNGAAIKSGARAAIGDYLVFMDADGQHDPSDIPRLIEMLDAGADMAVGARARTGQASIGRGVANGIYNRLASWMTGQPILDLTSGFRAVRRELFLEFINLLPNGFSYPTTITMCFMRAGYNVEYAPINVHRRIGKSHISPIKDGLRFLIIIFKIGTLYSPLKIFVPTSAAFFGAGLLYYLYTLLTLHRFTNMSALLLTTAVIIFMMGLVSEQITTLTFQLNGRPNIDRSPSSSRDDQEND